MKPVIRLSCESEFTRGPSNNKHPDKPIYEKEREREDTLSALYSTSNRRLEEGNINQRENHTCAEGVWRM